MQSMLPDNFERFANLHDRIDYTNHHKKSQFLTFVKEESAGSLGTYKSRVIHISSGSPANSGKIAY
jgi:hypothetical protein